MEAEYGLLLKRSWSDLKNNLVIFLPVVFSIILAVFFGLLVILEVILFTHSGVDIKSNIPNFIVKLVITIFIDSILIILGYSLIGAMKIGILSAIMTRKKANANDMWVGLKRFTILNFNVNMIKISIFLVPLVLFGLIAAFGFMSSRRAGVILAVIFGLIYLFYAIIAGLVISIGLFFIQPIMSLGENKTALELMKRSLKHAKENMGHTIISWGIVFGINFSANIIYQILTLPLRFGFLFPLLFFVAIPFILIITILFIAIEAFLRIFAFNAYFNKDIKKL